jgi:hypothetical protein
MLRMYTSVMFFALVGFFGPAAHKPAEPKWLNDYDRAWKVCRQEGKPLAVFLAPTNMGPEKLIAEGRLEPEVQKLLGTHYVCVFLDTRKKANQGLADTFDLADGQGIVISDRSGSKQAFRQEGRLPNRDLERSLRRYADPDRVVLRTETNEDRLYHANPVRFEPVIAPPPSFAPVRCST